MLDLATGEFFSHVAQKFGGKLFSGICNCMGGLGKYCKEVEKYGAADPCPLLIITGEFDDYKSSCIFAKEYIESRNFYVEIIIIPELGHIYPKGKENEIWTFFKNNKK